MRHMLYVYSTEIVWDILWNILYNNQLNIFNATNFYVRITQLLKTETKTYGNYHKTYYILI